MIARTLALALVLSASPALATVNVSVFQGKSVIAQDPSGFAIERIEPIEVAVPGDVIVYRYSISNEDAPAADGVVINTEVPANTSYQEASAQAGAIEADILLSADGSEFAPEGEVMVLDIDETLRPARPEDITHIRWVLRGSVPGYTVETVEYRARINR